MPLDVCNERTLSVFNLNKEKMIKNNRSVVLIEKSPKGRDSIIHSSVGSEKKIRKTLSFSRNLVEVISKS